GLALAGARPDWGDSRETASELRLHATYLLRRRGVTMSRHRSARPETLRLVGAERCAERLGRFTQDREDLALQVRGVHRHAGVDDEVGLARLAVRGLRQLRLARTAHQVRDAEEAFPQAD